jgi:hypothetical protein
MDYAIDFSARDDVNNYTDPARKYAKLIAYDNDARIAINRLYGHFFQAEVPQMRHRRRQARRQSEPLRTHIE